MVSQLPAPAAMPAFFSTSIDSLSRPLLCQLPKASGASMAQKQDGNNVLAIVTSPLIYRWGGSAQPEPFSDNSKADCAPWRRVAPIVQQSGAKHWEQRCYAQP